MKTLIYILLILFVLILAAFVGKTTIDGWQITIERPVSAVLYILMMLAYWFEI